jgi:uncharacterized repeat protein (TIGR03843 family)
MNRVTDAQPATETPGKDSSERPVVVELERILNLLAEGELELVGLLPGSSNYTYLARVSDDELEALAVYKPQRGERPLWDFPDGTLCYREVAAFLVSQMLGWPRVPPTVLRDGPHGLGAVQLFVDANPNAHYLTFAEDRPNEGQRIALFDFIANNADRKSGHCLLDGGGRVWCIDHGITFHSGNKLRTVIWDYAGQPIPQPLLDDLAALRSRLTENGPEVKALARLLSVREMDSLRRRIDHLLQIKTFPEPGPYRSIPWPPV